MRAPVALLTAALLVGGCAAEGGGGPVAGTDRTPSTSPRDAVPGVADCPIDAGLDEVPPLHPSVDDYPTTTITLVSADGECQVELAVAVADSGPRRAHGLMEVPELPDGTGMLFTYPDEPGPRRGGYYMKDTLVPLTIAYLGADGSIVDLIDMDPCTSEPCTIYTPSGAYRATLEVPQGWFDEIGLTEDWRVRADIP